MKVVFVFALLSVALASGDQYDTRYDNFDVEGVLKNKRILTQYAHCFLETGPCTPEGKEFKQMIPDGVKSSCAKCSEKQKSHVAKFIKAMQEQLPSDYETLYNKFDPEKKNTAQLKEYIEKYAN